MDLRVKLEGEGSERTMHLEGAADLATAPDLRHALQSISPPEVTRLVLDVSRLDFCDSTALGTMIGALRRMREGGGELEITGAHGTFLRLLEITGLDKVFTIAH